MGKRDNRFQPTGLERRQQSQDAKFNWRRGVNTKLPDEYEKILKEFKGFHWVNEKGRVYATPNPFYGEWDLEAMKKLVKEEKDEKPSPQRWAEQWAEKNI